MLPTVSIVISVKNEEKYIADLLDSIASLDYPKHKLETIVVEGGSTDKTVDVASRYPFVNLISLHCNLSEGRNIGIKKSTGEIMAFLDGDCIVDKDWLKNIVKHFQRDPEIVAIGGPYLGSNQKEKFAKYREVWAKAWYPRKTGFTRRVIALEGGNSAYRRKIFDEVGLFDENLGRGSSIGSGEDVDFNLRVINAGYKLFFAEDVKVYHKYRTTFKDGFKTVFMDGMDSSRYYRKYSRVSARTRLRSLLIPFLFPTLGLIFISSLLFNLFLITNLMLILFFCYYIYKLMRFHRRNQAETGLIIRIVVPIIDIIMMTLWSLGALMGLVI